MDSPYTSPDEYEDEEKQDSRLDDANDSGQEDLVELPPELPEPPEPPEHKTVYSGVISPAVIQAVKRVQEAQIGVDSSPVDIRQFAQDVSTVFFSMEMQSCAIHRIFVLRHTLGIATDVAGSMFRRIISTIGMASLACLNSEEDPELVLVHPILTNHANRLVSIWEGFSSYLQSSDAYLFGGVPLDAAGTAQALSIGQPNELLEERKPIHDVIDFIYDCALRRRLRRKGDNVYEQVYVEGIPTRFFRMVSDMKDFMYSCIHRGISEREYLIMTTGNNHTTILRALLNFGNDHRLPLLVQSRYLFSYRNGIFNAERNQFYTYFEDLDFPTVETVNALDPGQCTSNYFDETADLEWFTQEPHLIETPCVAQVLDGQHYPADVQKWVYAMGGRLCFDIGSKDEWQICFFCRGVPGAGKSTLFNIYELFYQEEEIGILMSDGQTTFSDEHLIDKRMVLALDIDETLGFNMTRFNSMVSGERMTINRKFKTALIKKWTAPMGMASNSAPPWQDKGGNLTRRFVILPFMHVITQTDTEIRKRAEKEIGKLLIKCVRSYHACLAITQRRSLWEANILPQLFHDARQQYQSECNSVAAFMESDKVVIEKGRECNLSLFRKVYAEYCQENKLKCNTNVLRPTSCAATLASFRCAFEMLPRNTQDGRIYGVGIANPERYEGVT
jgi:hypothetical protein